MRKLRKAGTAIAAAGLIVAGTMTGTGVAHAATGAPLGSCDTNGSALVSANVLAQCQAGTSTVADPSQLTVTVDPSFFTVLLGNSFINALLGGILSAHVTYTLSCVVDGNTVTSTNDTGFTVSSAANNTHTINLQSAVGSPLPDSCTLANLKVTSAVSLGILSEALSLLGLNFTFGVSATADTGVPGAIFFESAASSAGAIPAICADDTGNANHGAVIQAYTCESDLADAWTQATTNQFVHNGDCLDDVGGAAQLSLCAANPGDSNSQVWNTTAEEGGYVELVNSADNNCLTASSPANATALTVVPCTGASGQLWKVPGVTPL